MYRFRTLPESALSDCAAPVDAGLPPPPQALNKDRKPSARTAVPRPTSADPLINRDPFDVASALYIAARRPRRDLLRGAGSKAVFINSALDVQEQMLALPGADDLRECLV